MKIIYSVIACNFFLLIAYAQGTWTPKANFGGSARYGSVGFSIGTKGYLGMGYNGTSTYNDLWEYDQLNNSWTQKSNCPGPVRRVPVAFVIGNLGYVGTGYNGSHLKDFWEYNPASNSWSQKADFGGSARYGAIGFSINGKGYIGFGNEGSASGPFLNDLWEYEPNSDSWTQKTSCPGPIRYTATGFAIGSKGYVTCGANPPAVYNDLYEFDPSANSWSQKADLPGVGRIYPFSFTCQGKGFVGGGQNSSSNLVNDVYSYNPGTDTWAQVQNFPGAAKYINGYFSIGDFGYVGNGYDMVNVYNEFWEYSLQDTCFVTIYDTITVTIYDTVTVYDSVSVTDTLIIDVNTGLNPPNDFNTIKVYPTPAKTHIYIDNGNLSLMNNYTLKITNSLSQVVFQSVINQQQFYIDLSGWTGNGIYFVNIIDPQNNIVDIRKIILQ